MSNSNNKLSEIENVEQCSSIYADNQHMVVEPVDVALQTLDGRRIFFYTINTRPYGVNVDLTSVDLYIEPGTKLVVKFIIENAPDAVSTVSVEYQPDSENTCYFQLTGRKYDAHAEYKGITMPD